MSSLPSRVLPSHALRLIHEYSKPLTRPDWRNSKPLTTTYQLYNNTFYDSIPESQLLTRIYYNILDTVWYNIYNTIKLFGIHIASERYKMTCQEILRINGMSGAVAYHSFWGEEQ
jgi:hypothetical protein